MYKHKLEQDLRCPMEYAVSAFSGKWKSRIICLLDHRGTLRYKEIKAATSGITDNMLAAALKELIAAELLLRKQYDEMPIRVEYALTEKGKSLVPLLHTICDWAVKTYGEEIRPDHNGCPYVEETNG